MVDDPTVLINDHLTASRNPHYWQKDVQGNKLPYLDKIGYRTIVDETSRVNALQSGELQAMNTTKGDSNKAAADR